MSGLRPRDDRDCPFLGDPGALCLGLPARVRGGRRERGGECDPRVGGMPAAETRLGRPSTPPTGVSPGSGTCASRRAATIGTCRRPAASSTAAATPGSKSTCRCGRTPRRTGRHRSRRVPPIPPVRARRQPRSVVRVPTPASGRAIRRHRSNSRSGIVSDYTWFVSAGRAESASSAFVQCSAADCRRRRRRRARAAEPTSRPFPGRIRRRANRCRRCPQFRTGLCFFVDEPPVIAARATTSTRMRGLWTSRPNGTMGP